MLLQILMLKAQAPVNNFHFDTATFQYGKLPVTNLQVKGAPDKIQFAIIADINGGNIPGVLELASSKIKNLQPPFLMSVGDLVDGYKNDSVLADKQYGTIQSSGAIIGHAFFYVLAIMM